MTNLNDIDTTTKEGRVLFAALVILTQSPEVQVQDEIINGRETSPDEMLQKAFQFSETIEIG